MVGLSFSPSEAQLGNVLGPVNVSTTMIYISERKPEETACSSPQALLSFALNVPGIFSLSLSQNEDDTETQSAPEKTYSVKRK